MRIAFWPSNPSPATGALDSGGQLPLSSTDTAELALARELDKVLSRRGAADEAVTRTAGGPPRSAITRDQILAHLPQSAPVVVAPPVAVQRYQARFDAGGDAPAFLGADTSLRWIEKAKTERRRRAFKNALGWVTTLLAGGVIVAMSAYVLTGWTPDWAELSARARDMSAGLKVLWH